MPDLLGHRIAGLTGNFITIQDQFILETDPV